MREGKRRSSWVNVDEVYEGAVKRLFTALIAPGSDFLSALRPFARRLAHLGMLASLGRTVLKCTLPGLPDTYQGTEMWDFSFVDPDNRRPVDYPALERMLEQGGEPAALLAHWPDGRVKQATLTRLLAERAERPDFYASAAYEPVDATGARAAHVIAYRRTDPGQEGGDLFVAVPRLVAGLRRRGGLVGRGLRGHPGRARGGDPLARPRDGADRGEPRGGGRSRRAPARAALRGAAAGSRESGRIQ